MPGFHLQRLTLLLQVYGVLQDNNWAIQLARVSGAITALTGMLDSHERACRAVAAVSLRSLCLNSAEACKVPFLAWQAPCCTGPPMSGTCSRAGAITALTGMLDTYTRACRAVAAVSLRLLCPNSAEACKVLHSGMPAPCCPQQKTCAAECRVL